MSGSQWIELVVFVILFVAVAVLGFVAARWKAGSGLHQLDEWGLAGRRFGGWVTWFLVGGDLYTAYTFVAVPALVFGSGAIGFYAVPYTVILYPIVFLPVLRLWSVSRTHGYITPADFVRGRYGSSLLALLIAITGIVATMPYIALQLAGIEAVLRTIGLNTTGWLGHLPLFVAFVVLAVYTYSSGLRAPALIAFVKDILIYVVILVAVIYLPIHLGGWGHIFDQASTALAKKNPTTGKPFGSTVLTNTNQLQYATLALGSALALFLYPHSVTGVLSSSGRAVIRRNTAMLPAYSILLG
ncbi:MAG TPA: sodium:solute symporter, partial [Pseudonocardiaceae bacterium]|nr:sodium:solute symporter [Pseudonocardiaceae bacterium]